MCRNHPKKLVRSNIIHESAEVGRLAVLPNISEVWIEGNPFVEVEDNYRVKCFEHFWKEGKTISLDGSLPGFYEKSNRTESAEQATPPVPPPPVVTLIRPPPAPEAAPAVHPGLMPVRPDSELCLRI